MSSAIFLVYAFIGASNFGALVLQVNHMWRGLNPDYSGLIMSLVVNLGLNAGYSAIAIGIYKSSHPLRFVLLLFLVPFVMISVKVSIPASEDVFVADTYKRINDERLGDDAVVYENRVRWANNHTVSLAKDGKWDEVQENADAVTSALAAKKAFMESGGTHESQTEKALLGDQYEKLKGDDQKEARNKVLNELVEAKGSKWAWTLEAIDKCLTAVNAILIMLLAGVAAVPTRGKKAGVMAETKKHQGMTNP